jgi:hypothetical protein
VKGLGWPSGSIPAGWTDSPLRCWSCHGDVRKYLFSLPNLMAQGGVRAEADQPFLGVSLGYFPGPVVFWPGDKLGLMQISKATRHITRLLFGYRAFNLVNLARYLEQVPKGFFRGLGLAEV